MKRKIIGILAALVLAGIGTAALVVYVESAKDQAVAAEALVDVYVVSETVPKGTPVGEIKQSVEVTEVPAKVAGRRRRHRPRRPRRGPRRRRRPRGRRAAAHQPARGRPTSSAGPRCPPGSRR